MSNQHSYQATDLESTTPTMGHEIEEHKPCSDSRKYYAAFFAFVFVAMVLYSSGGGGNESSSPTKLVTTLSQGIKSYSELPHEHKHILFQGFKDTFNKQYEKEEEPIRLSNFVEFLDTLDERNAKEQLNGGSAIHGITKFADWSEKEFKNLLGYSKKHTTHGTKKLSGKKFHASRKAKSIAKATEASDWSDVYTTAVKDQGYCGSCWAFSATEQIESDAIRAGYLSTNEALSPQQIVSCDTLDLGCDGGDTELAYFYVFSSGGLESNKDYPYTSYWDVTGTCKSDPSKYKIGVTDFAILEGDDVTETEQVMMEYVLSTGPLSVCLDASNWASYTSGVLSTCGDEVDHCVQAVGVDTATMTWKIRNSWGTDWGDDGYIYLSAMNNTCDITYDPTFVEVTEI